MFYSHQQKFKDPKLQQYCFGTENCRRITLLHRVGSLEDVSRNNPCCDVCTPGVLYAVDLLTPKVTQKRHLVQRIGKARSEQLRLRLVEEKEN